MTELINDVVITVAKADGEKCPRCWIFHTIKGNPLNVCDRCLKIITDLYKEGKLSPEDTLEWKSLLSEFIKKWKS